MFHCPRCGHYRFNVYYRELVCREYDSSRPGDEWDRETAVETEACVEVDCDGCGADLSHCKRLVKFFAKGTRDGYKPLVIR